MSQAASLEEIDERLSNLQETLVVDAEDARAIAHLMALRVAGTSVRAVHFTRRPMVRLGAVAMTVAIVILLNLVAAYYAPTYNRAIANAPGIGGPSSKILAAVGLRAGDVTSFNDSASSRGHTLRLVAGYADGLRTVLFISIDGKGLVGDPKRFGMNPGDYGMGSLTLTSPMDPELLLALGQLPTRQRAALWLRYCDDLSVADVARVMHCSETAAKQVLAGLRRAHRGRERESVGNA